MRRWMAATMVAALCVGGAAGAQEASSASGVIQGRKAALNLSGAAMAAMKAAIDAGGPVQSQAFAARALGGWARAMPGLFPEGSGVVDNPGVTRASAAIWTDRAGFEAKAAAYAAAADRLAELARANDTAGFAAQWTVVREACSACHQAYRTE